MIPYSRQEVAGWPFDERSEPVKPKVLRVSARTYRKPKNLLEQLPKQKPEQLPKAEARADAKANAQAAAKANARADAQKQNN